MIPRLRSISSACGLTLLFCVGRPCSAYEVSGGVAAAAQASATNANYSASFTAGLPIIGTGQNVSYRLDESFWTSGGSLLVGVPVPDQLLPRVSRLYQNRPNPFGDGTTFVFDLSGDGGNTRPTRLDIFDVNGRLVRTLVDGVLAPGRHEAMWDAVGDGGRHVPTGIYLARFRSGVVVRTVRVVVVK
jgi:hypothetical protein